MELILFILVICFIIIILFLLSIFFFGRLAARAFWIDSGLKKEWEEEHGTKIFSLK